MEEGIDHPAAWPSEKLLARCQVRRLKRGGPGGQHRNKVETAVIITDPVSGQSGEASERRSQEENRQMALFRLRVQLALGWVEDLSDRPLPSPLWRSRLKGEQIVINPTHADFPSLLAEALAALRQHRWDVSRAARLLGCTTNQLVKFLKHEPRALILLNKVRSEQGLRPLK